MKIHLDSSYVKDGITKWFHGWKKKGWKKEGKTPIKNIELWQCLDRERNRFTQIEWCWVKGHAGNPGNEKADELANKGVAGVWQAPSPRTSPLVPPPRKEVCYEHASDLSGYGNHRY